MHRHPDPSNRVLWSAGDRWPGDLRGLLDDGGLTLVTHRGTAHFLTVDRNQISWVRQARGEVGRPGFRPTAVGSITPCGATFVNRYHAEDWHSTSRVVWIAAGHLLPVDDELDRLIAVGTGPVAGHPDRSCATVYCDVVALHERRAHLERTIRHLRLDRGEPLET